MYEPGGQRVQPVPLAVASLFSAHESQVAAPSAAAHFPRGQAAQGAERSVAPPPKWPAAHAVHPMIPPPSAACAAGAAGAGPSVAGAAAPGAVIEYLPAGHALHASAPGAAANLPAGHSLHRTISPASGLNRPAPHAAQLLWPAAAWKDPGPHASHCSPPPPPLPLAAWLTLPGLQAWQPALPSGADRPAVQAKHSEPAGTAAAEAGQAGIEQRQPERQQRRHHAVPTAPGKY